MDNNQQVPTDAVIKGPVPPMEDLNLNNPGTMQVGSPLTGQDVSMTTPQNAGGNITTTEAGSK